MVSKLTGDNINNSAIKNEEYLYYGIFNNSHTPMLVICSKDGRIKNANQAACSYYGYSFKDLVNLKITDINVLDENEVFEEMEKAKTENRNFFRFRHKMFSGEIRDVEVYSGPIKIGDDSLLFSIVHDIQEKRGIEEKLIRQESLLKGLFENSPEAIAIVDNNFRIININESFERIFLYTIDEVKGQNITNVLCNETFYNESAYFKDCITKGEFVRKETLRMRKDGKKVDVSILAFPVILNGENVGIYCTYSDITIVKEEAKKIEILTNKDSLTGLYNRDFFMNRLNYDISKIIKFPPENRLLSVLFMDLDDFKDINDNLGHLVGDTILKEFSLRLKYSIRKQDIAARFGGDEFIILLSSINDKYEVINISNKIIEAISKPYIIDGHELHITASMGIANFPDDGTDSTALIRNADIAMYRSKQALNRKITIYHPSLDKEIQENFNLKNKLRNAINNNELFLVYQPIFDTEKERTLGVEALLRWKSDGKVILPSNFIDTAEKTGMIYQLGEWVLYTACKQNKSWQDKGYTPIFVSVNVSVMQLEQPDFVEIVEKALEETKLDPQSLQLEITETIFTKNYKKIVQAVRNLTRLGVKVAIDDFGTGYSSLGQLSELDINKLKIDRSFVNGVTENPNKRKIVKAIISMAKSLNLELVAEGVETLEQLDFLRKNDCSIIQGYIYSRPVEPESIEGLLQSI